jgi:hypothetical protein
MTDFLKNRQVSAQPSDIRFRGFNNPRRVWRIELSSLKPSFRE